LAAVRGAAGRAHPRRHDLRERDDHDVHAAAGRPVASTAAPMTAPSSLAFVVDDEPAMLDIVTFALETQGFTTESFRSAEAAWSALERSRPDLVVLDIMLPGISGISLCQRIKSRWDVPVMLVTAKGEVSDRIAGLEAEA